MVVMSKSLIGMQILSAIKYRIEYNSVIVLATTSPCHLQCIKCDLNKE